MIAQLKILKMNFPTLLVKGLQCFASARMGFYAILKSLNWFNDEIIIQGYTCSVMINTV